MAEFNATGSTSAGLPRAIDTIAALRSGELSATGLVKQTYTAIEARNPRVNAICTLRPVDAVLADAEQIDRQRQNGASLPPLAGVPIAVKDLANTQDLLTTLGSEVFKHNVPTSDALFVERLKKAGAIIIGKTNTPELGAGSHTFNSLFGTTRNPYDTRLTAGGSSGGAAAALASGMLCLADGSDMGGSLRNPAAFCNVVGLRPSMGRVPTWPQVATRFARMGLEGPMARTVEDLALLLSAMAGPDPRDRLSYLPTLGDLSVATLATPHKKLRLGWAPQPAGLPVETEVLEVLEGTVADIPQLGHTVKTIALDELKGAMPVFETLRAAAYAMLAGTTYKQHAARLKKTLGENIRRGLELDSDAIYRAEMQRTVIDTALQQVFNRFDYLLLPTTQVMPFPVEVEFPTSVNGKSMQSYIEWMSSCCILSPFDVPCLSLPAGFSSGSVPVGIQIVGRLGDEQGLLRLAYALQQMAPHWQRAPKMLSESTS